MLTKLGGLKIAVGLDMLLILFLAACIETTTMPAVPTSAPDDQAAQASQAVEATSPEMVELTVFTAASLTDAFTEIGQNFEGAHPGVKVTFNFAGSQQLAQQLGQGAPADVFASANNTQMGVAIEAGRVISGSQQIFAHNRLTVVYPADNPAGLSALWDLANPDLHLILAAAEVPAGQYSLDFLDRAAQGPDLGADYKEAVLNNVVSYEQNVRVVLTKVVLGEGDAGIVYTSDVTPDVAGQVGQIEIPEALNTIAAYPIAPVSDSANAAQAQSFVDYVLAPAGQEVLVRYGFIPITR